MTAQEKPRTVRLSVADWTSAALDLLVREGVAGVKISTLCAELGVTKGSFYWHFVDINALMAAVADQWCASQNDAVRGLDVLATMPVEQRLEWMASLLIEDRAWSVERAVRDWARTNEQVAASVQSLDQRILEVVTNTMEELGFDEADARLRAGTLVYAGIGFVHGRGSLPTPTLAEVRDIIAVLTSGNRPLA
ncbi:TetR/AcrR family transcriptional regulator [Tomitella biformata]|uniref:TetR/AcrR family transcriptional regulator n=1 Tax=Tomitella biformata TaxID=630403 RepID=UPI00056EDF18|nr:TetR/AcrR family transcriptional regulator [Tomitella biformata]